MNQYNLYTPIKHQRRIRVNKIIHHTLDWCIDKWGLNGDRDVELDLDITYREHEHYGNTSKAEYCYEDNEIIIYPNHHSNVRDLIDSIIHEFTHQRQDMSKYIQTLLKSGYQHHPLEIEAMEVAKKYRRDCCCDIKKEINL